MRVRYANIRIAPRIMDGTPEELEHAIVRAVGLARARTGAVRLVRRSIDARKKGKVAWVVTADIDLPDVSDVAELPAPAERNITVKPAAEPEPVVIPNVSAAAAAGSRPIVVGAGPCGLFCALYLAHAGLRPILIERGEAVEDRARTIERFEQTGQLDPNSNIQFGEGGAGTYSDGKLTTGTRSAFSRFILKRFVAHGAPASILVDARPHVGTDHLPQVVSGLRAEIEEAGGEVRFSTLLEGIGLAEDGRGTRRIMEAQLRDVESGEAERIPCDTLVLALGHSARDTYEMLCDRGITLERKQFAVGARIEHPQPLIDRAQYGPSAPDLPSADYKLAMHDDDGRGAYTFCMCPGGEVVAAASEEGGVCVNGQSRYARDGDNANAALLVEVRPDDLPGDDVLAGVRFQRELERRSFEAAREVAPYAAPAQYVGDFLAGRASMSAPDGEAVAPTYPRGVSLTSLDSIFPAWVTGPMREAIRRFDRKLAGFASSGALLTAPEARSSAPVRIVRDDVTLESVAAAGLYPAGEGAGYAGGIMSAAADGLRVAERIVARAASRGE